MEIALAVFILITIYIDSIAIMLKGLALVRRFAIVYVVSQALSYITRFSLFFILPIIGLILDGVIDFDLILFMLFFSIGLFLKCFIFYRFHENISRSLKISVYEFSYSLKKFFIRMLTLPFKVVKYSSNKADFSFSKTQIIYLLSHIFLTSVFPILLILGSYFLEYRASIMGAISIYTGVFSIYIVFYIERPLANMSVKKRHELVKNLLFSKLLSLLVVSSALMFISISLFFLR